MKCIVRRILLMSFALAVINSLTNSSIWAESYSHSNGKTKVDITFISNCSFLVVVGEKKILFDLEDPSKSFFKNELANAYELMYANKTPFHNINYLLISHEHADHFGVKEVSKLLISNPSINLFTTSVVIDELKKHDKSLIDNQKNAVAVNPFDGGSSVIEKDGIKIEFLGTYHAGAPNYVVPDLCFAITVDDARIFYMSDIDPGYEKNYEAIKKWSAKKEKIDLLFAPDVVLYLNEWSSQKGIDAIKNFINPTKIIATHLNPNKVDESASKVKPNFKNVLFLNKSMTKVEDLFNLDKKE